MPSTINVKIFFKQFNIFLATGCGVGQLTFSAANFLRRRGWMHLDAKWSGAGLLGSVEGAILAVWSFPTLGSAVWGWIVFVSLLAVPVTGSAEKDLGQEDPPAVILDEIVGMFWALVGFPIAHFSSLEKLLWLGIGFILFRIFDATKCMPGIRQAQNWRGGWGIVMDDIVAGLWANVGLHLFFWGIKAVR